MLHCALALLLVAGLGLPYEVDTWPLDTAVVQQVERASANLQSSEEWVLRQAVAYEQRSILDADMVFIGTWEADGLPVAGPYGTCQTSWFRTERCLKGECRDTVLLHRDPTAVRAFFNMPLGTRLLDWSEPEAGRRYLFMVRAYSGDSEFLFGGFGHDRYEFSDGAVVGKGVPETEFLAVLEGLLDAAVDHERSMRDSTQMHVQPSN